MLRPVIKCLFFFSLQYKGNANGAFHYIFAYCLDGVWLGAVVFFYAYFGLAGGSTYSEATFSLPGTSWAAVDHDLFGGACALYVVFTINARVLVFTHTLNWIIMIGVSVTVVVILLMLYLYSVSSYLTPITHNFRQ